MSYVYLIVSGSAVKIGIAENPQKRLVTLQIGHHDDLRIYHTFQCADKLEAAQLETLLHRRYASDKLRGEWFSTDPEKIVADVLSDKKLKVFISKRKATKEKKRTHKKQVVHSFSPVLIREPKPVRGTILNIEDFLVALALAITIILSASFGSLIGLPIPIYFVHSMLAFDFGLMVIFAVVLAKVIYEKVS